MAGAVKLPGIGEVPRNYVYAGGAAIVGIVGVAYLRRGLGAGADTGAQVAAEDPTAAEGDYAAGVDAYANPAPAGSTTAAEVDPDTLPPTTNSAWTSRAVDRLANVGYDPIAVTGALGRFLARKPLGNQGEVEIVQAALAMVGPPPSGEYSILSPAPAATAATPTPAPAASSPALKAPTGLKVSKVSAQSVYLDFAKVPGAKTYLVTASNHGGASTVTKTMRISGGYVTNLKPMSPYRFTVRAVDAKGNKGPASGSVSATTKRK